MLYTCYDLIPLHVVMELSWRHGLTDFTMPFLINYMAQQASTIEGLKVAESGRKAREEKEGKGASGVEDGPILGVSRLMLTQGPVANGMVPQQTGYGGFR